MLQKNFTATVCFTDFGKLNLLIIWGFNFMLEPIFAAAPMASKLKLAIKSGQNWLKNNNLTTMI